MKKLLIAIILTNIFANINYEQYQKYVEKMSYYSLPLDYTKLYNPFLNIKLQNKQYSNKKPIITPLKDKKNKIKKPKIENKVKILAIINNKVLLQINKDSKFIKINESFKGYKILSIKNNKVTLQTPNKKILSIKIYQNKLNIKVLK